MTTRFLCRPWGRIRLHRSQDGPLRISLAADRPHFEHCVRRIGADSFPNAGYTCIPMPLDHSSRAIAEELAVLGRERVTLRQRALAGDLDDAGRARLRVLDRRMGELWDELCGPASQA